MMYVYRRPLKLFNGRLWYVGNACRQPLLCCKRYPLNNGIPEKSFPLRIYYFLTLKTEKCMP